MSIRRASTGLNAGHLFLAVSVLWSRGVKALPSGIEFMANTSSAKKAVRKIEARTAVNRSRRSNMRTFIRKVEEALASGDAKAAATALHTAEPVIMRAAQNGIVHKNTASRKVSRLAARVKTLAK